jgi:hypothetical protein
MPIEEATESQSQPKYITVDDVLVPNPKYRKPGSADKKTTVANPEKAIAITSTPEDLIAANEARMKESKQPVKPSRATAASIQMVQDEEYLGKFNPPAGSTLDCADVIDGITEIFSRYEVPIGLLNKLLALN